MRTAAKPSLALVLAVCVLAAPATARAAFAPRLAIELDTTEHAAAPAITSTITQAQGETAIRSARLVFPEGFEPNPAVDVASCGAADESARTCPPSSRIGSGEAVAGGVQLSGPIHFSSEGGQLRVLVFLQGLGGLVQQKLVGRVELDSDGRLKTVFDDLPNTSTTSVVLRFLGGTKALVRNPLRCGDAMFRGAFTSHSGEEAIAESSVAITGCPSKPAVSAGSVRPKRVRAGRPVTVRWSLSEATNGTRVILERRSRHRRWWRVASVVGSGNAGANRIRLSGRRLRRAGSYRVALRATNSAGVASNALRIPFRVLHRGSRR